MAETTTSQNQYLGVMPSAERQAAISQTEFLSTRPTTPKTGFYSDGTMSPYARRKIRMHEEWDKRYEMMINQEESARKFELDRRQAEIYEAREVREQAKYLSEIDEARAQAKIDSETETQRSRFDSGFADLDPRDPKFLDQLAALRKEAPLAFVVPEVKGLVDQYTTINTIYRNQDKEEEAAAVAKEGLKNDNLSKLTKLAKLTGRNLSDLAQSDINTGELIVDPLAVGEAEAELATKPAKEITDPAASVLRQEAKELRGSIRDIEMNIVTAQTELQSATNDKTRNASQMRLAELTAQRNLLYTDLQGVDAVLAGAGQEAPTPAVQKPTNTQIESARRGASDQTKSQAFRDANIRFLQDNGIEIEAESTTSQTPQPSAPQTAPSAQQPQKTETKESSQKPFNPKDRAELARLEAELQKERERVGLTKQPAGIRQVNEAMASQYASVREKAAQLKEAQERIDPFAESNAKDAQDIQSALDVVYPAMAAGGFDVGNSEDPRVVSAAEYLTKVSPSLLRMVASAPASNRSGLSLQEIYDIAKKAKRTARGRPNKK